MSFWTFHQNNSGGRFGGPAINLIVEAETSGAACDIAESEGAYFNGCDSGVDCSCCGDRWYRPWSDEGETEPLVCGKPPVEHIASGYTWGTETLPEVLVIYADGRREAFHPEVSS